MDSKNMDNIIQMFYDGETSLEEEKFLKNFIARSNDLSPEHNVLQTYFTFTKVEKEVDTFGLKPEKFTKPAESFRIRRLARYIAFAATVVLFISISGKYRSNMAIDKINRITYNERKQVYVKTKEALLIVSISLNKGTNEINRLAIFDQVKKQIIKN